MKNRNSITMIMAVFLLSGCRFFDTPLESSSDSMGNTSSETTSSETTSNESTSNKESSESSSNSANDSSSTSSEDIVETLSIKEVKTLGENYKSKVNEAGVYLTNKHVAINNLQLISCLDAITTKKEYNGTERYKILMSDGKDYIYVQCDANRYLDLKKYENNRQTYNVSGYIAIYCNEVELKSDLKSIVFQGNDATYSINYFDMVKETLTIDEIYNYSASLWLNVKGIAFNKLVKTKAFCLGKDFNNTNAYFGVNDKIIILHGSDKLTNHFEKGLFYELVGAINVFNYRVGLEYVDARVVESGSLSFNVDSLETLEVSKFYNYSYPKDAGLKPTCPNYTNFFKTPKKVECYVNFYNKDGKFFTVLDSTLKAESYYAYTNARDAKALFVANEMAKDIPTNSPLLDVFHTNKKMTFVVFPYMWNTNKYPMVYIYNLSETLGI